MRGVSAPFPLRPFVDGAYVPGDGPPLAIIDPATNDEIARVEGAGAGTIARAVAAARRVFDDGAWPGFAPAERGAMLRRIGDAITARCEEIARLECANAGKPISAARREIAGAARVFGYYAGAMDKLFGTTIPMGDRILEFTLREPVGVAAQIVPWNFPFLAAAWKIAPALAAGCTVVLKPAPATPLTALLMGAIANEAGVPPGAFNILPGGAETGRALVCDRRVDKIAFTGATSTGAEIMRLAADGIRRVTLELGGKSPSIVFADADIARAARTAVAAAFGNAGQNCSARARILVERPVHQAFVAEFGRATAALRIGPPAEETTELGPLISPAHWDRVHGYVTAAESQGARRVLGGFRPAGLTRGNFYAPTIFTDVRPEMALAREEVFGPVAAILGFADEAEAIRLANDTVYGLNASVWSGSIGRALRVARALRTGMVAINGLPSASQHALYGPFGGYKQSGHGRELGMEGLAAYTEIKTVTIDHGA